MPKWSPEDEQFIHDNHAVMRDTDIAVALKRSVSSVQKKRHNLGIRKEPGYPPGGPPQESATPEQVSEWERKIIRLTDELSDLKKRHKEQTRAAAAVEAVVEAFAEIVPDFAWTAKRPPVKPRQTSKTKGEAVLLLSDLHFGAVVDPEEVPTNAYNIEIAHKRLERVIDKTILLATEHLKAKRIHVLLMGDLVSGLIHDELEVTNEASAPEQVVEAADAIQQGLQRLGDAIGAVSVVSVSGNHGRLRHQKRLGGRQVESFDWLCAQMIKRGLASRSDITWTIPRSPWTIHSVAGMKILVHHGDTVRSWGGLPAYGISRDAFRRKTLLIDHDIDFDLVVMGHLHQHGILPITANLRVIMNGSLVGMDPYADSLALGGTPSQTLFGAHPDHGVTSVWEIKTF